MIPLAYGLIIVGEVDDPLLDINIDEDDDEEDDADSLLTVFNDLRGGVDLWPPLRACFMLPLPLDACMDDGTDCGCC